MRDIVDTIQQWQSQNQNIALATVVKTWGSAPRREGSKLAVTPDLSMVGSVSGGCVENAVIEEALNSLKSGQPQLLHFGVSDDTAWDVGLTCGGKISILVEALDNQWYETATRYLQTDERATTITALDGNSIGHKALFDSNNQVQYQTDNLPDNLLATFQQIASEHAHSGQVMVDEQAYMVDVIRPRPHLIIVGGVHVAQPLTNYAHELGFRVSINDPRSAFATDARFPDVNAISHDYPDKALPELGLSLDTFLAVLTHDPKIDDPALITALNQRVGYIGVLSSRKTHNQRTSRLKEAGITDEQLAQIHTPIGIDIGASNPEEIALCIMAEIIAVRNGVHA